MKIPYLKVTASKICFYELSDSYTRPAWTSSPVRNLHNDPFNFSDKSRKELKEKIESIILLSRKKWIWDESLKKWFYFKLNFITLTLSDVQHHSDVEIKNLMLNNFLTRLRQLHNVTMYVWRAETQANGNIHFHIITNVFIHYDVIRKLWNSILKYHGYCNNHDNPNSTDVHSCKRIRNLAAYLVKYFSKIPDKVHGNVNYDSSDVFLKSCYNIKSHLRCIAGRDWGCSYFLSAFKGFIIDYSGANFEVELKILFEKFKVCYYNDFVSFIYKSVAEWKPLAPLLYERFKSYLWDLFADSKVQENFIIQKIC